MADTDFHNALATLTCHWQTARAFALLKLLRNVDATNFFANRIHDVMNKLPASVIAAAESIALCKKRLYNNNISAHLRYPCANCY